MSNLNYFVLITILISLNSFLFKKDYNIKSISLFYILFVMLVVLSEIIFGLKFTENSIFTEEALNEIIRILTMFVLIFLVFSSKSEVLNVNIKIGKNPSIGLIVVIIFPAIIFLVGYAMVFGFRLDGSFVLDKHNRSSLDYYVYVYILSVYVASAYNKSVALLMVSYGVVYIFAGERMKGYLYVLTLLIGNFNINKNNLHSVIILISGFFLAEIMSYLRSGLNIGELPNDVNISHFGEVTVSSIFMLSEAKYFNIDQNVKFGFGMIIGNIIPAEILPESMDMRRFIFNAANIPGGGWLPVFVYSVSSIYWLAIFAAIFGLGYAKIISKINKMSINSIMKRSYLAGVIVFTATLPNWFMYTPYQVLKMPLYAVIGTYIISKIINSFNKRQLRILVSDGSKVRQVKTDALLLRKGLPQILPTEVSKQ